MHVISAIEKAYKASIDNLDEIAIEIMDQAITAATKGDQAESIRLTELSGKIRAAMEPFASLQSLEEK